MPARVRTAFQKLMFCYSVAADAASFFRLLRNTKKFRWFKEHPSPVAAAECESYHLTLDHSKLRILLRTYQGDIDIFYEIFWKKVYDTGPAVPACRCIVDIGSNVGMSALYFLGRYPDASLLCLEPEASNFRLLQQNIQKNYPVRKVSLLQAAVLQQDGMVNLKNSFLKYNTKVEHHHGNIKAVSMSTLFHTQQIQFIDLLKMDAEGSEEEIFSGDTTWLEKVGALIIETHSVAAEKACLDALHARHFQVQLLHTGKSDCIYFATRR